MRLLLVTFGASVPAAPWPGEVHLSAAIRSYLGRRVVKAVIRAEGQKNHRNAGASAAAGPATSAPYRSLIQSGAQALTSPTSHPPMRPFGMFRGKPPALPWQPR